MKAGPEETGPPSLLTLHGEPFITPLTLEMTLTVQQEIQSRLDETDRLHHRAAERARYEADLARRR